MARGAHERGACAHKDPSWKPRGKNAGRKTKNGSDAKGNPKNGSKKTDNGSSE